MLHHITEDGHLHWHCHGCQQPKTAHVTHAEVGYPPGSDMVALPRCECGKQHFLKVQYTEEELQPPRIFKDSTGKIIKVEFDGPTAYKIHEHVERDHAGNLIRVCDGVSLHPAIPLHQELARQLETIGKKQTPLPQGSPPKPRKRRNRPHE